MVHLTMGQHNGIRNYGQARGSREERLFLMREVRMGSWRSLVLAQVVGGAVFINKFIGHFLRHKDSQMKLSAYHRTHRRMVNCPTGCRAYRQSMRRD